MGNNYTQRKDEVWDKGSTIRGKDADLYRKDIYGNEMYYHSYGKDTPMGWTIDHSKPQSKGGTHHLNNLQPMKTSANKSKGNKY
jgi:HNH endonuclease